jgi:hypothetical protein
MSFSAIPNYRQAISQKGVTERTWYQFFNDVWKGRPQGDIQPITVGTSPFTYQVTSKGFMVVKGGTVSLIQFTRDGITNVNTGITAGCIPLSQGDSIIVTYSVTPTMTWIPQ